MSKPYEQFCNCFTDFEVIMTASTMEDDLMETQQSTGVCADLLVTAMALCVAVQTKNRPELAKKIEEAVPRLMQRVKDDMVDAAMREADSHVQQ